MCLQSGSSKAVAAAAPQHAAPVLHKSVKVTLPSPEMIGNLKNVPGESDEGGWWVIRKVAQQQQWTQPVGSGGHGLCRPQ